MFDIREFVQGWAPVLIDVMEEPYWVCIYSSPAGPDALVFEFFAGVAFDEWSPQDDCIAIVTATSATAIATGAPPTRCRLVCGVSVSGEAYAVVTLPTRSQLTEGAPNGGLVLDALRGKFGQPPAAHASYDVEFSSCGFSAPRPSRPRRKRNARGTFPQG
jgi:hypothetical protein